MNKYLLMHFDMEKDNEKMFDFLCDLYADRDMYSRGTIIDKIKEELRKYDLIKNVQNTSIKMD